jgi:GNAT superfamily N-acetyltransferase
MRAAVRGARSAYPERTLAAWASLPALYHAWAMTAGGETILVAELGTAGRADAGRIVGKRALSLAPGRSRGRGAGRGGERIVGYAGLRGSEVTALFVRPSAARRGVASALLARIEALARRRGVGRLFVDAARSGVAFYRARGFTNRRTIRVPLPGGALLAVRMEKRLRARGNRILKGR